MPAFTLACNFCAALQRGGAITPVTGSMSRATRSPVQNTDLYLAMNTVLSPATGCSVLAAAPEPDATWASIDCSAEVRLWASETGSPALK